MKNKEEEKINTPVENKLYCSDCVIHHKMRDEAK